MQISRKKSIAFRGSLAFTSPRLRGSFSEGTRTRLCILDFPHLCILDFPRLCIPLFRADDGGGDDDEDEDEDADEDDDD